MGKRIAIVQSNYIPWRGYFDLIAAVDEFILYDDVQYTRRDWRNRNQIKTSQGLSWITVPVKVKGNYTQMIRNTEIDGVAWAESHWKTLVMNYRRARYFDQVAGGLEPLYLHTEYKFLSSLNRTFIEWICSQLHIKTKISNSWDFNLIEGRSARLADLCQQAGGAVYISGPAAKGYLEESAFATRDIQLVWFDYNGYSVYPQLWGDFQPQVSILDLLFNCGPAAPDYMRYVCPKNFR